MSDVDLSEQLTKFILDREPTYRDVSVLNITKTSAGFARENWCFDAEWTESGTRHSKALIMRRDPGASLLHTDRVTEAGVLKVLSSEPRVLAPEVYWLDEDGSWLGHPAMIMERIDRGICDWFVLNDPGQPVTSRLRKAQNYISLLGALHTVGENSMSALTEILDAPDKRDAARVEVEYWAGVLRQDQLEPYPDLQFVKNWLLRHAPTAQVITPVHGDYKPGNILIDGEEITALLDWELLHLGDPLEDLGWVTNPTRRGEHQIDGSWERQQIAEWYSDVTGFEVPEHELLYWNVFANFKLATIYVTGLRHFIEGTPSKVFWGPENFTETAFDLIEEYHASVS